MGQAGLDIEAFIRRWDAAPIGERAHCQTFITQLCSLIGVTAPDQVTTGDLGYCFERPVRFAHEDGTSHHGFIDCYRAGCFVLEGKQSAKRVVPNGSELDPLRPASIQLKVRGSGPTAERMMRSAKRQAENYAKALDEWPPFLVIVDVGCAIELWSDFKRQGKAYAPFPDRASYRISLTDLRKSDIRERLAAVWTDPLSLDPATRVAAVTTDIGQLLARLLRSMRTRVPDGPDGRPDSVTIAAHSNRSAHFVMQCIFAMFADSVGLIDDHGFLSFLKSYHGSAAHFHKGARDLFRSMDVGGHCSAIRQDMRRFNGGLFAQAAEVEITEVELELLIAAAGCDWASVEPAIFGSLLEQALDANERVELGAHYTPREYVERLIEPTIMEPLRIEWEAVEADAIGLYDKGQIVEARLALKAFHRELCLIRVLDPACGTGNFLYVAMRMMKELEGEVLAVLADMGEVQGMLELDGHTVSPAQFYGLEKNVYAAWITELVMWIGYLQWHFRLFGDAKPSEPILKCYDRIVRTDALVQCSGIETARGGLGRAVVRDVGRRRGETRLRQGAPRSQDREVTRLINPCPTAWPDVHFIVGNPPFMGAKDLRRELGDGYVDALWAVRQGRFRSADLVTAWWDRAAEILVKPGSNLRRFGFITTNSITQTFSRRVLEHHLCGAAPVRLVFAIPDHPWTQGKGSADVRISMTVAERGEPNGQGRRLVIEASTGADDAIRLTETRGNLRSDLSLAHDDHHIVPLKANALMAYRGVQLMGAGFIVDGATADALRCGATEPGPAPIRAYRNGRDLAERPRDVEVIDLYGWAESEVRRRQPAIYQHLLQTVKPDRDRNARSSYRNAWWVFGEPRRELRDALSGLPRYIATVETAKHRWFTFQPETVLPDNRLVCIASDDAGVLAVLSSRWHAAWALRHGGRLEDRPIYTKGVCFDAYPFPVFDPLCKAEVEALAEELDALRWRLLGLHPALTMTALYNARDRYRSGLRLSAAEKRVHELGCVAILDHLHDRIDRLVADAYGFPEDIDDDRAVAWLSRLNQDRAQEEATGQVRFLRPDHQLPRVRGLGSREPSNLSLALPTPRPARPPSTRHGLASALLLELRDIGAPLRSSMLASRICRTPDRRMERKIEDTLSVLAVTGAVHRTETGWFAPRRHS